MEWVHTGITKRRCGEALRILAEQLCDSRVYSYLGRFGSWTCENELERECLSYILNQHTGGKVII